LRVRGRRGGRLERSTATNPLKEKEEKALLKLIYHSIEGQREESEGRRGKKKLHL